MRLAILTAFQLRLSVTQYISNVLLPTSHVLKPHNFPHPDTKTPRYSTRRAYHHRFTSTRASTSRRESRSTSAGMLASIGNSFEPAVLICLFSAGCTTGTASTKAARERAMIDLMNCIVFPMDRVGSDG
ncbi:hypothetical protein B0F90DRAFT_1785933 [Multifurca ochricompacta]|uniref:Uncharacterized protein n=1 Tax=Multifurca ochricompacta TaxID=376703 RepID=A0AAD4LUZ4_9AGAM|nr:hypothetical protein B0F90DRAFT_1785933 [Multifurca ochricompacta]